MFYHASGVGNIKVLKPRISNHGVPLVYFSTKRENALVYLSNAIEKYCKEQGFVHNGVWSKWGPYGFTKDGILQIEEYYPNALADTYKGVSGYIYSCESIPKCSSTIEIPDAAVSNQPVYTGHCEWIADAFDEIMNAVSKSFIKLVTYEEFARTRMDWLYHVIREEYKDAQQHPEYQFFLKGKFPEIVKEM